MRHRKKSEKFSRPRAQREALIKSLLRSLIIYERIRTTTSKAKAIRPMVEKLISLAKRGDLHSRRLAYSILESHVLVKRLFDDIGPRFNNKNGGYTRIFNIGTRKGDGAGLSLVELTQRREKLKKKKEKPKKEEEPTSKKEEKKGFLSGVKSVFKKKDKGAL